LFVIAPILGVVAAVVVFGALAATSAALSGIFNAALYRYAVTGSAGGPFSVEDLHGSFRPRQPTGMGGLGGFGRFGGPTGFAG
jgi:hypothetical protein